MSRPGTVVERVKFWCRVLVLWWKTPVVPPVDEVDEWEEAYWDGRIW